MTTSPHTPNPVDGADIDALGGGTGLIYEPNDDEDMRAQIIRAPVEQLADWIAFIRNNIRDRVALLEDFSEDYFFSAEPLDGTIAGPLLINSGTRYYYLSSPSYSGTVDIEIDETEILGPNGAEIGILIYGLPSGTTYRLVRPGGLVLFSVSGVASYVNMKTKRIAGNWRYLSHVSDTAVSVTSP